MNANPPDERRAAGKIRQWLQQILRYGLAKGVVETTLPPIWTWWPLPRKRCSSKSAPDKRRGICVSWRGFYFDTTMPAGFHVPSPAGSTEGGVSLGQ
ncbi:hypothetical protein J2X66_003491 [Pseudomonas sp. 3296]|nr:hypothetical protein [Pseudomonas sp. 3296]